MKCYPIPALATRSSSLLVQWPQPSGGSVKPSCGREGNRSDRGIWAVVAEKGQWWQGARGSRCLCQAAAAMRCFGRSAPGPVRPQSCAVWGEQRLRAANWSYVYGILSKSLDPPELCITQEMWAFSRSSVPSQMFLWDSSWLRCSLVTLAEEGMSELENQYFNSAVDGRIAYHSKHRFLVLLQVQSSNACGSVFLIGLSANKEALFQISVPKWHAVPGCSCSTKDQRLVVLLSVLPPWWTTRHSTSTLQRSSSRCPKGSLLQSATPEDVLKAIS